MIARLTGWYDQVARVGLILSLGGMLTLSCLGILTRWMGSSWLWVDPLARHLVLVAAFLGSVLAVARKNHIRIDILAKPMERAPASVRNAAEVMIVFFSAVVTFGLAYSAWQFFLVEREFSAPAFLEIPSHFLVGILPVGLALVSFRWVLALFHPEKV
jgi:TRAP-type C4-dicarboxylate transport system permease small subunit